MLTIRSHYADKKNKLICQKQTQAQLQFYC